MSKHRLLLWGLILSLGIFVGRTLFAADTAVWDGKIIQYGKMREAVGAQQHQGRVQLAQLVERPHFFGVAALEGLAGEVTIHESRITATGVNTDGQLGPVDVSDAEATLLVGAYIPSWTDHVVARDIGPGEVDQYLADVASRAGVDVSRAFVFTADGEFSPVRLHVIHGACPMHARLMKTELPPEQRPFEADLDRVRGTMVGVFAIDAVGDITHPATMIHAHLVFEDRETGKPVTGHIEQIGLVEGAVIRLPQ